MSDLLTLLDNDAIGEVETFNQPTDLIQAERLVAEVKQATDSVKRIKEIVEWVNNRGAALVERENRKIANATQVLEPFVKGIVMENLKVNPKAKKSVDFITGSAGFRKGRESLEVVDAEQALDACHKLGIETIVHETVSKTKVKEYVQEKGAVPDGIEVKEGEETFTVKVV